MKTSFQWNLTLALALCVWMCAACAWAQTAGDTPTEPAAEAATTDTEETTDETPEPESKLADSEKLARNQTGIADRFQHLEKLMERMAEFEEGANPDRARLLRQAFRLSRDELVEMRLNKLSTLLRQNELKRALDSQDEVSVQLRAILDLLLSEDQWKRNQDEQKRIARLIKELNTAKRIQQGIRGSTQGGGDMKKNSGKEGDLEERVGKIKDKLEGKPGEGKPGEGKPGEGKPGEGKPGEGKPGEGKPGEEKPGKEKPGEGKPGEGKPGEGKPGEGKPGEGKPGEGEPGEGEPGEGGGSPPPPGEQPKDDDPATKRVKAAQEKMRQAKMKLEQAKRDAAVEDMRDAEKELAAAIKELEEILRQLREEELARTLAMLEARFAKMLKMQLKVYEDTQRLHRLSKKVDDGTIEARAGKLSYAERKIESEANRALMLLREEGSSVAFPLSVEIMIEDISQVVFRLADSKVARVTQGIEEDIIETLEKTIEALQKAQKDLEEGSPPPPPPPPGGQPQPKPLVDQIAELKMIKGLQEQVNRRTKRYSNLLDDVEDPVGQATQGELVKALKGLSGREKRIKKITRDIVLGKNQ